MAETAGKGPLKPHARIQGFTLIELLIVVIILGIAILLALPQIDTLYLT